MGRHSAPDDQPDGGDVAVAENTAALDLTPGAGRHSAGDDDGIAPDEQPTQMIAAVQPDLAEVGAGHDTHVTDELPAVFEQAAASDETEAAAPDRAERRAARAQRKAEKKAARGESGTEADLRLLRQRPAVRAQCLAAVVVSFGLYTLVMFVIGETDRYLAWLWTPIVVVGVLIGVVLDLAHRRERAAQASGQASESASEPPESSRSA